MMPNNVNDVKLRVTPLQYIDVVIDYVKCKCLCDSGAHIPMINKDITSIAYYQIALVRIQSTTVIINPCMLLFPSRTKLNNTL